MYFPTTLSFMSNQQFPAASRRIAIVDIGSNSIRYMEAEHSAVGPVFSRKEVYTTRLAEGLLATGCLSEARMAQSLDVLRRLAVQAAAHGCRPYAYATSAVRDARNRESFVGRIALATGMPVRVLAGNEEAAFAYVGATGGRGGLIDIGGGSTQVTCGAFRQSFPLGCVRVKDLCGDRHLAEITRMMQAPFAETFQLPPLPQTQWTAVGGTATTLAALRLRLEQYDPVQVARCQMTLGDVQALLCRLDDLGDAGRSALPLLAQRHDVILGGGAILTWLMERLSIVQIAFSDADGMEGYARSILGC